MLLETFIVVLLASATILIMHIFLIRMLKQSTFHESFIRSNVHSSLSRPVITENNCNAMCGEQNCVHPPLTTLTTANEQEDTKKQSQIKEENASEFNFHSLEDELKQWMQQESKSWTDTEQEQPTNVLSNASTQSTSIDSIFNAQQVNMSDVQLPILQKSTPVSHPTEEANDKAKAKAKDTLPSESKYNNTMNSGDLGNGLSAFDTMESSYASF